MPYRILIQTTISPEDCGNPITPIVCRFQFSIWMAQGRFVLLHECTETGKLDKVSVGELQPLTLDSEVGSSVNGPGCGILWPGQTDTACTHLTANYQTQLEIGETYHLLWPGGEIEEWD